MAIANNLFTWRGNVFGAARPYKQLANFGSGATQAIAMGDILEFTGNTNTEWVPIDSDFNMNSNIAVAAHEIKDGTKAGYFEIIVPRPGDIFEYALVAAAAPAIGDPLYFSAAQIVTVTAGTNILARVVGDWHIPGPQHHLADGQVGDKGTTIRTVSFVNMIFVPSASVYSLFDDLTE